MSKEELCYKCEERYVGCKSDCPRWAKYAEKKKAEYERRRRINETTTDFYDVGFHSKRKADVKSKRRVYR